ncbi:anti-sigma factor [Streptomyces verrucosisporus]|uniref:anti-sigma factor n=1 Tax=Streptomyces verrucosisporus TaxID=1695161 RepID=UPI0019CFCEEB|nr:anti-sigma factor [Streptomyces verrucosisporus]MBN3932537.1 anti-sigma factor [Streptomyces verrucosisporus]
MSVADLHTLTGAYAVDALDGPEREDFERHLAVCAPCRDEVRELTATAARLGPAASAAPPPGMREEVLRRVATVRQEPPRARPPAGFPGSPVSPASTVGGAGRPRRRTRLVLAACLASAVALGGVAAWQYDRARDARQSAEQAQRRADELTGLLAAPDARIAAGELPGGGSATVVVSRSRDRAAFLAARLPEPPAGKVYQLWFDDEGAMRPAGVVDASGGRAAVMMDGPVAGADGMGVTVEPEGGSAQPTSEPLAVMEFPAA